MRAAKWIVATLLLAAHVASCAPAQTAPTTRAPEGDSQELIDALRNLHFDKYLATPQFHPSHTQSHGWDVYSYPTDELQCIDGGEYFLMARPGAQADSTVLWLEGGGACWPGRDDCTTEAGFNPWIEEHGLASPDASNPVKDWNFIYVPYCDGSIHLGDSEADYNGDGVPDHHHMGLKTTSAAIRLMKELFPASRRILVAGCSAGAGGTIGATLVVRLQFPEARLYVLSVSGLGLIDPARTDLVRVIEDTWNIGQFLPTDCPRCEEQLTYMYAWLLDRDTALKVGAFSAYRDATVRSGWGMTPEAFQSLIRDTTEAIRADHPDTFKRYFISGDVHCIDDYAYRVDGVSFWEWIGYLVNDDDRWVDILE
jgi:hypothetical protein